MGRSQLLRSVVIGAVISALALAAIFPIFVWGSDKAPEFYGAFMAAIVAAVAVILGAYYQAELTHRRDITLRRQERNAEAIDLCFWLEHSSQELEFIEEVLQKTRDKLVAGSKTHMEMPLDQFREIISAQFFEELLPRAKIASQLPRAFAGPITRAIYNTFRVSDRIFLLRGAVEDFHASVENIDQYLLILNRRSKQLRVAADLIQEYLVETGEMAPKIAD